MEEKLNAALKDLRLCTRRYVRLCAKQPLQNEYSKKHNQITSNGAQECITSCEKYFNLVYDFLDEERRNLVNVDLNPKKRHYSMEGQFKRFYVRGIKDIFGEVDDKSTISVLPYLMASFYINVKKELIWEETGEYQSSSFQLLFVDHDKVNENLNRNVRTFVKMFSLADYMTVFCSKQKGREPRSVQKVKSREQFADYLGRIYYRETDDGVPRLEKLQYESILYLFVYSLCVLACINTDKICSKVDYLLSFRLFAEHTQALNTNFLSWPKNTATCGVATDDVKPMTIKEFVCADWAPKHVRELITQENMEMLAKINVYKDKILDIPCEPQTDAWARNVAYMIVVKFFPFNYPDWSYKFLSQSFSDMSEQFETFDEMLDRFGVKWTEETKMLIRNWIDGHRGGWAEEN